MKFFEFDSYNNDYIVHKLDARIKILFTIGLTVVIFGVNNFAGLLSAAFLVIAVYVVSGIPIHKSLKALKPLLYILIFTALFHSIDVSNSQIDQFHYGFIKISPEGLKEGLFFSSRIIILVVGTLLLSFTTSPSKLIEGLESILSIGGIFGAFAHKISMIMGIAIGYIPLLITESEKIMLAQTVRGADFDTANIIKRLKNYLAVIIPLFVSSFRKADNLSEAMEARCYSGYKGRTRLYKAKMQSYDWLLFAASSLIIAFIYYVGHN